MVILQEKENLVLRNLLNETKILFPILDVEYGYRYPAIEKAFKGSPEEITEILNRLHEKGFLSKRPQSVIIKCPHCGKYGVIGLIRCPTCNGGTLNRYEVLQHRPCGYTGSEEEFTTEREYICPYCKIRLKNLGEDYEKIGSWYKCNDCGATFGEPKEILYSTSCKQEFAWSEASTERTYVYEINEKQVREQIPETGLERTESLFQEQWETFIPSRLNGKSGVQHVFTFSLLGKEEPVADKKVVVDVEYGSEPIAENAVMNLFSKCLDVNPDLPVLIAVPKLSQSANDLSKTYDIRVLEGEGIEESLEQLKTLVDSFFKIGVEEKKRKRRRRKKQKPVVEK
ncbi:MAG: hypothetical protein GTN80_09040 [Nitrososphaeria archaeon]|nr:hypothetical protein [Nitrososphaeria archaeon]NIN53311.1 hypothetical protein [Nitrososphaeria archaeon]NIQ33764.1 hypothetical protein [Nitrososphaeria archaeon]